MDKKKVCVGVVGAGDISDIYLKNMTERYDNLYVKSICAGHIESARKKADVYGLTATTMEEMLADQEIEMIVNLTPAYAHYEIIKRALEAGKHVYTEKIMTDDLEKSAELVALAQEKGLNFGSAPDTFMGAALQRARAAIDDGLLGEINSFAISGNRNNDMLLSAYAYMRQPGGGVVCDYGVYYATALVSLLGPVKKVGSIIRAPYPTHVNTMPGNPLQGQIMDTPNDSEVSAVIQLENGITGTFHINSDSIFADEAYFYIYGKKGILVLPDPNQFNGEVRFIPQPTGEFWKHADPITLWNFGPVGDNLRGIGPSDLARAVLSGDACRPSKEMAYHVHEVLAAMLSGGEEGAFVNISSTCSRPEVVEPCRVPAKKIAHLAYHVKDTDSESCSQVTSITQVAYQVKDERNMLNYYTKGLGFNHAARLTFGDLADSLAIGGFTGELLSELRQKAELPYIDYIEVAPHQYIELFYTGGREMKEALPLEERYGYQHICVEVESICAAWDAVTANGIQPDTEIDLGCDGTRVFWVKDPDGNRMEFHEYTEKSRQLGK